MQLELKKSELDPAEKVSAEERSTIVPSHQDQPEPSEHNASPAVIKYLTKKKGILSRSFKAIRDTLFSSLTRRILFLNMLALAILLSTILYMNQFREGLIDAKIESLLTQGRIIAGALAGSATANPDAITIDPDRLLELKAGESLQPRLDPLDTLRYPINP